MHEPSPAAQPRKAEDEDSSPESYGFIESLRISAALSLALISCRPKLVKPMVSNNRRCGWCKPNFASLAAKALYGSWARVYHESILEIRMHVAVPNLRVVRDNTYTVMHHCHWWC